MAASTGRGGAGNIGPEEIAKRDSATPESLATPTIKKDIYTTGRGGKGNMAKNDPNNPAAARAAQDVEAPAHNPASRGEPMHHGRGGEGNYVRKTDEKPNKEKELSPDGRKPRTLSASLMERAREGFDKMKRSASGSRNSEAIEEK